MAQVIVRHAEPDDYQALHRIFSGPKAIAGTIQLPLPSAEAWRKRLVESPEGLYSLVACVDDEVVGSLGLETSPTRWRMRHVGSIGMAVRDAWLNLTRIELRVYVDNAAGVAFRSAKDSTSGSSRSPQNTPLTSGVPSSCRTTRNFRIL